MRQGEGGKQIKSKALSWPCINTFGGRVQNFWRSRGQGRKGATVPGQGSYCKLGAGGGCAPGGTCIALPCISWMGTGLEGGPSNAPHSCSSVLSCRLGPADRRVGLASGGEATQQASPSRSCCRSCSKAASTWTRPNGMAWFPAAACRLFLSLRKFQKSRQVIQRLHPTLLQPPSLLPYSFRPQLLVPVTASMRLLDLCELFGLSCSDLLTSHFCPRKKACWHAA